MNSNKEEVVFWALPPEKVFEQLKSSEKGLTSKEAEARLIRYGPNDVVKKEHKHGVSIFFRQFKSPLILILIIAALISFFLGEEIDSIVIWAIIMLNAILGFLQEYKAERILRELRTYLTKKCKVLRDGKVIEIDSRELVPGDIVHLNIGDIIPADIRLLDIDEMTTDESSLTGESMPVIKKVTTISEKRSVPQYLQNIAFMGTSVASGLGKGIVIATGKNTFFGKTSSLLKQKTSEDNFQKNIRKFGNYLLRIILIMTIFIFLANAFLGKGYFNSFLFAVALAVGITPEVLPIIMTITLSNGAMRMAKEKVIIKKLVSVEDLGNIDTLCCDKTGTLTEGRVVLREYLNLDGKIDDKILLYGLLCNSTREAKGNISLGNPLDKAIWLHERRKDIEHELNKYVVIDENDFDFTRRRMSVVIAGKKLNKMIVKGAPESVLAISKYAIIKEKKTKISKKISNFIIKKINEYENEGYKVIAVAERSTTKKETTRADEKDLVLLGFMLFFDPPKETAREALETMQKLGVRIKILSGDSPTATKRICNDVGLSIIEDRIITGDELETLSDSEFEEYSNKYNVFARITPEQKYKIVSSLNKEGHVVGFLGDGINDAPALKIADVGISVDTGAGIAKEAADIILLKKSLRVLAQGIIEGRKTFSNITKYILNTISANYGNMFTVSISSLFLRFIPLLPSQILLNNFLSDMPLLAISTDNVDSELIKKPKKWSMKMISRFMIFFGIISTLFDIALILPLIFVLHVTPEIFRTAWFVESALSEIIITFAIRTKLPFYKSKPSKLMLIISLITAFIVIGIVFTDFGTHFFNFISLPVNVMFLIAGVLVCYFVTAEFMKRHFFKKFEM